MKIVNRNNLPESVYQWLLQDFYDRDAVGDSLSATTLLKPIQQVILEKRYWDQIEIDATDRIWSLFGSGVHAVMEKLEGEDIEPIKRLYSNILGVKVSGKPDMIKQNVIYDYKVTSVWTVIYGSRKSEWQEQLSIYRWLYWKETNSILDENGKIVAILRDWADRDLSKTSYPKMPILEIPIKLIGLEETEAFIATQVSSIGQASKLTDSQLPKCTDEERWYHKTKRIYQRCAKYCPVSRFCKQYQEEQEFEKIEYAEDV